MGANNAGGQAMSKLSRNFALTRIFILILAAPFSLSSVVVPAADEVVEPDGASSLQPTEAASPESSPWPVQVTDNGRTFLIYQPQVDKWENNRLEGRSAVSVRNDASGQQNFGVVYFSARTELDQGSRTVTVRDAVVSKADFPAVTAGVDDYLSVLRPQFAAQSWRVAQDRLQSDMEIDKLAGQSAKQPLKNDPPRILYSERPTVLVPIDGNPVLRPVADTALMRVTNTRALILQDKATSRYYLFVSDHWMESQSLDGPWSVAASPSAQLEQARQLATQQDQVDLLDADAEDGAVTPASVAVFVSTTPTELLQTDGPAQYSPIERTQLLYVTNSPNKLFLDLRTQNHYALISGRWYRTTALAQGQWSYVPAASLPGDFAMIPAEHPTESVRAAVPGTPQAREAVIANTVPQVATVARSAAHLEITYDGNPVFQPIEGTALQNAVNSPVPVIRVSEESFYALDNGVWFVASSPFGPWAVTSYVPSVIYSIPRSSPLYNVTYVRVYDATPEVVYVGYTPGYVGSYVSSDNVVVYGTGWPYRPWIGSVWYGAPVTWGFGFSFVFSWWDPFPWHSWHRVGWATPRPCYRPWWGPWHAPVYGRGRPGFVAGGINAIRPSGPGLHNVGRIYDRWDRRSVVWNGPRAIANQRRPAASTLSRPAQGNGFVAGADGRWRRPGDEGNRDRGRRDTQVRRNVADSPVVRTPPALQTRPGAQTPPAVQTPWRRPPVANQQDRGRAQSAQPRVQPPSFGGNERRSADNRQLPPRERVLDQRQPNQLVPRAQVDGRPVIVDRPRANVQQDRPAPALPQAQSPQRMPPVAGVPVERAPAQPQRAMPQLRSFSPPAARIERPAMASPGRIERPAAANSGRGVERPSVNAGRIVERSAERPQFRGNEGRAQSNSGWGRGEFRAGERNR
jgi:hypothetical protein